MATHEDEERLGDDRAAGERLQMAQEDLIDVISNLKLEVERAIAVARKHEKQKEEAMQLVGSAIINIRSAQALQHLLRYFPNAISSNSVPNIHNALQDALVDLEKAQAAADLIPF